MDSAVFYFVFLELVDLSVSKTAFWMAPGAGPPYLFNQAGFYCPTAFFLARLFAGLSIILGIRMQARQTLNMDSRTGNSE